MHPAAVLPELTPVMLPDPLPEDPLLVLATWLDEARRAAASPNPEAMALATATPDGGPSARFVLC